MREKKTISRITTICLAKEACYTVLDPERITISRLDIDVLWPNIYWVLRATSNHQWIEVNLETKRARTDRLGSGTALGLS